MFWRSGTTINETCSCGAKFEASGILAASAAAEWRLSHSCRIGSFRSAPQQRRQVEFCSAGVGGGEVCARQRGHDGPHDPDSTEVAV